jgi:hypothetical protein
MVTVSITRCTLESDPLEVIADARRHCYQCLDLSGQLAQIRGSGSGVFHTGALQSEGANHSSSFVFLDSVNIYGQSECFCTFQDNHPSHFYVVESKS